MFDNDHIIQREYADRIRERESKLELVRDSKGQPKFQRVAVTINEVSIPVMLRQYQDEYNRITFESLIIGNDLSNSNERISNTMLNDIRNNQMNDRGSYQRCHINLKQGATIALIFEIQYKPFYVVKSLKQKYGLSDDHLRCPQANIDIKDFMNGQLVVTSLVKRSQDLFYIDKNNKRYGIQFGQKKNVFDEISQYEYRLSNGYTYKIIFNA